MYTPLSWYLHGTKQASQKKFLATVEKWLTSPDRKPDYEFKFEPHLSEISQNHAFYKGEKNCSLEIVKTEDEEFFYTSIFLEKHSGNTIWIVDCVFRQDISNENSSCFVINFRKKTQNLNLPSDFFDAINPPLLAMFLIEEGIASKESDEKFNGMLIPQSSEDIDAIENPNMLYYPIVRVNVNDSDSKNFAGSDCVNFLLRYQTICHLIINDITNKAEAPLWAFRVEYPRLKYITEYYSYQAYQALSDVNSDKKHSYTADMDDPKISRIPLASFQIRSQPYVLIKDILPLVNEGISFYSELDRKKVVDIYEKNKISKRIPVTHALATTVSEARRAKGMTQNELADATAKIGTYDSALNSLLISRIEKERLKRIEISKLETLEKCLDLPKGSLIQCNQTSVKDINSNDSAEQNACANFNREIDITEENGIRFCENCGKEYISSNANFCSFCGYKKHSS